ncbi:Chromosome partition protein Smc [Carpediemonas membranifera]|uniref:Chromosome partition protein Smc n=1 Tax=Carpediemonas membranifera TaxID=201153 RepID=A0A8J6AQA0_9EUKA|nr:Chromosome partition protein Smc [Carpediemonas membranifera]|eukprot:KAG9391171.1 Chromosome partition protein Smc [Carpediemonas membranifera]
MSGQLERVIGPFESLYRRSNAGGMASVTVKPPLWALRIIGEIYEERDIIIQQKHLQMIAAKQKNSKWIYECLFRKYGLRSLTDQKCHLLYRTAEFHAEKSDELQMFLDIVNDKISPGVFSFIVQIRRVLLVTLCRGEFVSNLSQLRFPPHRVRDIAQIVFMQNCPSCIRGVEQRLQTRGNRLTAFRFVEGCVLELQKELEARAHPPADLRSTRPSDFSRFDEPQALDESALEQTDLGDTADDDTASVDTEDDEIVTALDRRSPDTQARVLLTGMLLGEVEAACTEALDLSSPVNRRITAMASLVDTPLPVPGRTEGDMRIADLEPAPDRTVSKDELATILGRLEALESTAVQAQEAAMTAAKSAQDEAALTAVKADLDCTQSELATTRVELESNRAAIADKDAMLADARAKVATVEAELAAAATATHEAGEENHKLRSTLAEVETTLRAKEEEIGGLQDDLHAAADLKVKLEEQLKAAEARAAELATREPEPKPDADTEAELTQARSKITDLEASLAAAALAKAETEAALRQAKKELEADRAAARENADDELKAALDRVRQAEEGREEVRVELVAEFEAHGRTRAELTRTSEALAVVKEEMDQAMTTVAQLERTCAAQTAEISGLTSANEELKTENAALLAAQAKARESQDAETSHAELESARQEIIALQAKLSQADEAAVIEAERAAQQLAEISKERDTAREEAHVCLARAEESRAQAADLEKELESERKISEGLKVRVAKMIPAARADALKKQADSLLERLGIAETSARTLAEREAEWVQFKESARNSHKVANRTIADLTTLLGDAVTALENVNTRDVDSPFVTKLVARARAEGVTSLSTVKDVSCVTFRELRKDVPDTKLRVTLTPTGDGKNKLIRSEDVTKDDRCTVFDQLVPKKGPAHTAFQTETKFDLYIWARKDAKAGIKSDQMVLIETISISDLVPFEMPSDDVKQGRFLNNIVTITVAGVEMWKEPTWATPKPPPMAPVDLPTLKAVAETKPETIKPDVMPPKATDAPVAVPPLTQPASVVRRAELSSRVEGDPVSPVVSTPTVAERIKRAEERARQQEQAEREQAGEMMDFIQR